MAAAIGLGGVAMVDLDQRLRGSLVAVIDTETTGIRKTDRVVEVGVVLIDRLFESDPLVVVSEVINPGISIPWQASKVHRIYDRDVRRAPPFQHVWPKVREALHGAIPCAYNASFDRRLLTQDLDRLGIPFVLPPLDAWLDPMRIVKRIDPKPHKLESATARRGIRSGIHRAGSDALATARLLIALIREAYKLDAPPPPQPTIREWLAWQRGEPTRRSISSPRPAPTPAPEEPSRLMVYTASLERSREALRRWHGRILEGKAICVPCSRLMDSPRYVVWSPELWGTLAYQVPCSVCRASSTGHAWGPRKHFSRLLDFTNRPPKDKRRPRLSQADLDTLEDEPDPLDDPDEDLEPTTNNETSPGTLTGPGAQGAASMPQKHPTTPDPSVQT